MSVVSIVVWTCWGLVAVVWIGGAIYNVRRGPHARKHTFGYARWTIVAIPAWIVLRRVIGQDALSFRAEPEAVRIVGLVLLLVATVFTLWARVVLGTMWSSHPVAKERHVLRTDGPYRVTRHPIYTGLLGMLLGTAIASDFGVWLYVFVPVVVFFELRIRDEERLMSEAFPTA